MIAYKSWDEQKQAIRDKLEECFREYDNKNARFLSIYFVVRPTRIPYCRYSIEQYLPHLPERKDEA